MSTAAPRVNPTPQVQQNPMNNPMVIQQIINNPNLRNNPALIQQLLNNPVVKNNPGLLQQLTNIQSSGNSEMKGNPMMNHPMMNQIGNGRFGRRPFGMPMANLMMIKAKPHFKLNSKHTTNLTASQAGSTPTPNVTNSTPSGYSPSQICTAYGLNNLGLTGAGVKVAIVDAYVNPNLLADFQFYDNYYKLGNPNALTIHQMTTGITSDAGWGLEQSLDVQAVHAIAPGASILMVQAKSDSLSDLLAAEQYATSQGYNIISNSWGSTEFAGEINYDTYFSGANICYLASSGDSNSVNWPSCSSKVLSVGGTTLTLNANGTRVSETTWTDSGSGPSTMITLPTYQAALGGEYRKTPDCAFSANPNNGFAVYDSFTYEGQSGWFEVGGTSLSSVGLAGVIALIAQARKKLNKPMLTTNQLQTYWYNTYNTNKIIYTNDFYQITTGTDGSYTASSGYNLCTGLGSCDANTKAAVNPVFPVLTGTGAPSTSLGVNGNSYMDLSTGNTYYKSNSVWTLLGNLIPAATLGAGGLVFDAADNI
jgi:subtilase family serine protease